MKQNVMELIIIMGINNVIIFQCWEMVYPLIVMMIGGIS